MASEKSIEAKIVRQASSEGWLGLKWVSPSHRGVPDRLFIHSSGVVAFMEIKRQGGKLTPLQDRTLRALRSKNQNAEVFDDVDAALLWLRGLL